MRKTKELALPKEYCTTCGTELKTELVGAEKFTYQTQSWLGNKYSASSQHHPYTAYDGSTGKRNYVMRHYCPVAWMSSSHRDYMEPEIIEK